MFKFINPGKSLEPWVFALEQEVRFLYIKKVIKKILKTTYLSDLSIYTTNFTLESSRIA